MLHIQHFINLKKGGLKNKRKYRPQKQFLKIGFFFCSLCRDRCQYPYRAMEKKSSGQLNRNNS